MPIPDFQKIMLPLLELAGDGNEHSIPRAVDDLADHFGLSQEERAKLLPSGVQPTFYNRVGWARTYLKKAKLLEDPRRGHFRITARGKDVLEENPQRIDIKYLEQFPAFLEFRTSGRERAEVAGSEEDLEDLTPEEAVEDAYQKMREDLVDEVLEAVLNSSPGFFEKLVVDLLVSMGYGGSRREAAHAVGGTGDEGIDGIIDEDRLGLDAIYVQAKKWKPENAVGRPEIQKFVGALQGHKARKGIFMATSRFTGDAQAYARSIDTRVILIDGRRLADLMIKYNVGVSVETVYEIKSVDWDYFGVAPAQE